MGKAISVLSIPELIVSHEELFISNECTQKEQSTQLNSTLSIDIVRPETTVRESKYGIEIKIDIFSKNKQHEDGYHNNNIAANVCHVSHIYIPSSSPYRSYPNILQPTSSTTNNKACTGVLYYVYRVTYPYPYPYHTQQNEKNEIYIYVYIERILVNTFNTNGNENSGRGFNYANFRE